MMMFRLAQVTAFRLTLSSSSSGVRCHQAYDGSNSGGSLNVVLAEWLKYTMNAYELKSSV